MTNVTPGWYADPNQPGALRYWDGYGWTEQTAPVVPAHTAPYPGAPYGTAPYAGAPYAGAPYAGAPYAPPVAGNGAAVASLVLGIIGFVLTPIPLGIGLLLGGGPDVLAIVFGIVGLTAAPRAQGRGTVPAVFGLVLGGLGFLSIFIGAGTIW